MGDGERGSEGVTPKFNVPPTLQKHFSLVVVMLLLIGILTSLTLGYEGFLTLGIGSVG